MDISHIGQSTVHTPHKDLVLRNILHVPQTKKNLISVHRFTCDNNVFLKYHPFFFLIKDWDTRDTLLRGTYRNGLYPLPSSTKQVFGVNKPSFNRWHSRLGHPSGPIVERVIRDNKLPFVESNKSSVCDACQRAKSHQLPYPVSTSVSKYPLELIFSYVWGSAQTFVGGYKYYVSFIDDYNKITWI